MISGVVMSSAVLVGALCGIVLAQEARGGVCPCDCDHNRLVTVDEVIAGVNIALDRSRIEACPAADFDGNGRVRVGELVSGVLGALHGCSCGETLEFAQCGGQCPDGGACAYSFADGCQCISPNQPCGGTAPACNGECPTGTVCAMLAEPFVQDGVCSCIPEGAEPCSGPIAMCGGWCPDGTACGGFNYRGFFELCTCLSEPCPPGQVFRVDGIPPNALSGRCVQAG